MSNQDPGPAKRTSPLALTTTLFALFAVVILGVVSALALATTDNTNPKNTTARFISFSSSATATATPDQATANLTISETAKSSKAASDALANDAAKLRAALTAAGVPSKDLASSNYSVNPNYTYTQNSAPILTGYQASQSFTLTVEKIADAGPLTDSLISAVGSELSVGSITPTLSSTNSVTDKARAEATTQAKARAEAYAKELGVTLGPIISLTEDSSNNTPFPIYASSAMASTDKAQAPTQIDPGQSTATVSVTVSYSIK